jgi:hypothetical protein
MIIKLREDTIKRYHSKDKTDDPRDSEISNLTVENKELRESIEKNP